MREMQESVLIGFASQTSGHVNVDNSGGRGQLGGSRNRGYHGRGTSRGRGLRGDRGREKGGSRGRGEVVNHGRRGFGAQGRGVVSAKERRVLLGNPPKSARSPGQ